MEGPTERLECLERARARWVRVFRDCGGPVRRGSVKNSGLRATSGSHLVLRRSGPFSGAKLCSRRGVSCGSQAYAFARFICCRARNTVRSPALTSGDIVQRRNATLRGSIRNPDQKVSSPTQCCFAWQAAHKGTAWRSPGFTPTPPSVPVRTCAASDGAALPHATQGS